MFLILFRSSYHKLSWTAVAVNICFSVVTVLDCPEILGHESLSKIFFNLYFWIFQWFFFILHCFLLASCMQLS